MFAAKTISHMKHIILVAAGAVALFISCKNDPPAASIAKTATGGPFTVKYEEYHAKKCVRDTICSTMDLTYPVLQGGSSAAVLQAVNDSTLALVRVLAGANPRLPVPQAFDSAQLELYGLLDEQLQLQPDAPPAGYAREVTGRAVWQTDRYLSYELNSYGYTGGAHPFSFVGLMTYDLSTGKALTLPQIVRDTNALRPLLEAGFVDAKKEFDPEVKLKDILFEPDRPLALPLNFCVVDKGVRFYYNPYEVAAYAYGPTDILLTWEQLGAVAERSQWLR
jgi:hypothetical protein